MFIEFLDKDGDKIALHINQIVGFEFKDQAHTKVQMVTGKIAEIADDELTVKLKFAEISKVVGVQLYWEFKVVQPIPAAHQSEMEKSATAETTVPDFPVVPWP